MVIEQAAALREGEAVTAGVGAIQDAQAVDAAGSIEVGARREVYQNFLAQKARKHLLARELVLKLALEIEIAVLGYEGDVGDTELKIKDTCEFLLLVVFHDKQASEPLVSLLAGDVVRMGVVQ